jgi:hypothetical protein
VGLKKKKLVTINEGSLQSNWARLLNNPTTTQLVVSNRTNEMNQQLVISKHVTIEKTFLKNLRDINNQVLDTKHTLNLGQLLQMFPDIKRYIFNPIPSKPILLESVVALVAIDHQMAKYIFK